MMIYLELDFISSPNRFLYILLSFLSIYIIIIKIIKDFFDKIRKTNSIITMK